MVLPMMEAYLKSSSAVPLSLLLPLSARRYTGYEAMPFFEGLLPEDDVREAVARQFHVSAMRPMELIRVLGKDCAGDVVILEEGDSCDLPGEAAYVPLPNTLEEIVRYPYGAIAQLRAEYRLSLAGGQEKIALFHDDRAPLDKGWFAPLAGAPSSHIIKPQIADRFPLLASNEFICMEAARAMGFEVPETYCLRRAPSFRCSSLRSRDDGGIRRRRAPGVAAGAPGRLLPSYRPHFGGRSTRRKNPIMLRICLMRNVAILLRIQRH